MPAKVFILVTRMDAGGAQEVALETAAGLDPARFEVRLLAGGGGALDAEAAGRLGLRFQKVPFLVHPLSPFKDAAALVWLTLTLMKERPQALHTHSSKAGALGRLAGFLARVPRVFHTVHGWSFNDFQAPLSRRAYVALERWLARLGSTLVVVAAGLRDKGLLLGIGRPDQYRLLRAGVDRQAWAEAPRSRAALKRRLPGLRKKVVGSLANLKPQKSPLDFVQVAAKVCASRKDVDFVYVGEGPLRAQAEALAQKLAPGRVHFLGHSPDPLRLAAGFDVFLLTSIYEGLPCALAQALCLGLPAVATAVDGTPELLKENRNGFLCQPRDVEALAERVGALLDDAALRRRLGRAARASVGPDYDRRALLAGSADLYGAGPRR